MQQRTRALITGSFVSSVLTAGAVFTASAANIDSALNQGVKRAETAQQQQARIDKVDSDIRSSEREYRAVVKEVEGLQVYVRQLNKQLDAQQKELKDIENSIRQVTLIERQITPLMLRMIDGIDQFVKADIPFQIEERKERVASLRELMGRSDVTVAEKYRKVMDAYQKEMDAGRTIKTYRGPLNVDGQEREVDFLRVGRVALMYQTLDGQSLGVWNNADRIWQPLDPEYKSKLTMALRIAREQAAPDLMKIPVAAPSLIASSNATAGNVSGETE